MGLGLGRVNLELGLDHRKGWGYTVGLGLLGAKLEV